MKLIVIRYFLVSSLFVTTLQLSATTYYIDFSWGNDFLSGTTIAAPWKTINKINNSNFQPGDSILFKKGENWKEYLDFPSSGNAFSFIVIGSYGEGNLPIITGVNNYDGWENTNTWTFVSNNIWSREQLENPQRMWINGEEVLRNIEIDSLDGTANVVSLRGVKINVSDFNSQVSTYDIASNNIQKDPLIETSDSANYFLTENSPCIDEGTDVGLTFDYYGNEIYFGEAPDIGIHEYSSFTDIFSEKSNIAINFSLKQNYPNPFNPTTTINYTIPIESYVKLIIYDILGNEISELIDEHQNSGKYTVKFNAQNMASGIYFYKLNTQKHSLTKKMILLR